MSVFISFQNPNYHAHVYVCHVLFSQAIPGALLVVLFHVDSITAVVVHDYSKCQLNSRSPYSIFEILRTIDLLIHLRRPSSKKLEF
jgi:hypothetical protein